MILIKLNRIPKKRQLNYLRMIINKFKFANAVVVVLANLNKKLKILIFNVGGFPFKFTKLIEDERIRGYLYGKFNFTNDLKLLQSHMDLN